MNADRTFSQTGNTINKILFVDDYWIDTLENLHRTLHQPKKYSNYPVLAGSYPWENNMVQTRRGPQWIDEERIWKTWYNAAGKLGPKGSGGVEEYNFGMAICLATSRDLINWEKPFTRTISYYGSKENNIVLNGLISGPIYDRNEPVADRRYKAMLNQYKNGVMSWHPIFSSDGVHWSNPVEEGVKASDETQLLYDEISKEYRFYCKGFLPGKIREKLIDGRPIQPNNHRCVYLSTSKDFIKWTIPELVFHADELDQKIGAKRNVSAKADSNRLYPTAQYDNPNQYYTDIYSMAVFNYEGIYIGMPCMFDQTGSLRNNSAGLLYPELATSRDGYKWNRAGNRDIFLSLGSKEDFDGGNILMAAHPIIKDEQVWFYYLGQPETHDGGISRLSRVNGGIGLSKLRLDGFISIDARNKPGLLTTKVIDFTGDNIWLNLDAAGGEVLVELLDAKNFKPLKGFSFEKCIPVSSDAVATKVQWQNQRGLQSIKGKKIVFRIKMSNAKLYSIQVK